MTVPQADAPPVGTARGSLRRPTPWPVIKFVAAFVFVVVGFYASLATDVVSTAVFPAHHRLTARVSAWILTIFGSSVQAEGSSIVSDGSFFGIGFGCDAIEPTVLCAAAIIGAPTLLRWRFLGVASAALMFFCLNIVRVVSLFCIQQHWPTWFPAMHEWGWPFIMVVCGLALWCLWMQFFVPLRKAPRQ